MDETPAAEVAIEFDRVVKRYGSAAAVDGVSLTIRRGELVTFLGPSGCGKTTSLRLIAGLELPTEGSLRIAGRDVSREPASARNVGMVFQSYALFPHMSVLDNVAYGPRIRGLSRAEAERSARDILAQVGLGGFEARLPAELSGGQQQRVAVARAIAQQPDVILFDEPLSNVDAKLRRKVRQEIRSLQRRFGLTAVYVTHDQEEALAVSDRIVVMDRGRIAQVGAPADLYERPASDFIADFIGDANLLDGVIASGRFTAGGVAATVVGPDGPARVSIRPERIALAAGGPARVKVATYLGSRMEYVVGAACGDLLVSRPIGEPRFPVGDAVTPVVDAGGATVVA
ncbi:MAG: ABC transporter ATP-binding protein [Rhodobacteraceae bacterium]|nr:MAG: ABC transporter ATP-binding protein [Paracoccaceae bacterium]